MGPSVGLDRCGKSRPTGIRSLDHPACSQSLYRLRYPTHNIHSSRIYSFADPGGRSLKPGSVAAGLMGLWVRIPPTAWMSLSCAYCILLVEVSASGWSVVQKSLTECGEFVRDCGASTMRRLWPTGGCCVMKRKYINPLKPELNPICYLLALLGAHHFLHFSRIRVKLLTFRLLMSHIYIYIYIYIWSTHS